MNDDGLTGTQRGFLSAQYHREAFTDLSASDINRMPMSDFARLTGRTLSVTVDDPAPPGTPRQDPAPAQTAPPAAGPQAIDVQGMTMAEYSAVRGQLIGRSPKEGRGIFDSVGSGSEEYTAAVRAQSGRTGWATGNVVESPRIDRAYVQPDPVDGRSARERFASPGGVFGS